MIDTMKFKIDIDAEFYYKLESFCEGKEIQKHYLIKMLSWGKEPSKIKMFASIHYDILTFEFSVPKYFFGTNIFMFYPKDLAKVLNEIRSKFFKEFGLNLPEISEWVVQRVDLCYAYKLPSQKIAEDLLASIQNFDYPRKKTSTYPGSGISFSGSSYDITFYLKRNEFTSREKKYYRFDMTKFNKLANIASGVFRFEVSFRKSKIKHLFNKNTNYLNWISTREIIGHLNLYLKKVFGLASCTIASEIVAYNRLVKKYSDNKDTKQLVLFLLVYRLGKNGKYIISKMYNRSQIYRNKQKIADAGVTIVSNKKISKVNLAIPSKYAVNKSNDDVAVATHLT